MPTKALISHPSQWVEEDIDVVRQTHYKMDLQHFQTYRRNKIDPGDMASINTKDHSTYIEVARADPGSVIRKSMFSVAAYRAVLKQKGGDVSQFDKEVESMFKKGPRGSWAPDATKVPIRRVMLVCQCENGVNVKYSDSDGFGRPGTMGLWDRKKQESIQVGCIPPASGPSLDASSGGGIPEGRFTQCTCPLIYPPPWYTHPPEGTLHQACPPWKGTLDQV